MSDHVTLIHQGRVALSGVLDEVRGRYRRSRVQFVEHLDRPPALDTALVIEGSGRTWSVVHIPVFAGKTSGVGFRSRMPWRWKSASK